MVNRKKIARGRAEREALVASVFGAAYSLARGSLPRGDYAPDDLLDAFDPSSTRSTPHPGPSGRGPPRYSRSLRSNRYGLQSCFAGWGPVGGPAAGSKIRGALVAYGFETLYGLNGLRYLP
jgi:hypothetical protein